MEFGVPSPVNELSGSPKKGGPWLLPLVLVAALSVTATLLTVFRQSPPHAADQGNSAIVSGVSDGGWTLPLRPESQSVSLTIDFGNGARQEFAALPWSPGMTVGTLLERAREFHPGIDFTKKGEGAMAMLTSLDGAANDAASSRFWLYEVDGRPGETSFEAAPLAAGQEVRWTYSDKAAVERIENRDMDRPALEKPSGT